MTSADDVADPMSTQEAAERLGLAVRSVQLMVDRGELTGWRTPGGHRRIDRRSVESWRQGRAGVAQPARVHGERVRALLIEDSHHFQALIGLVLERHCPEVELSTADDGIDGLVKAAQLQPDLLLVDVMLPGIDGATLVARLRTLPAFAGTALVIVTSLGGEALQPFRLALDGLPVVHKSRLVDELPRVVGQALAQRHGGSRPLRPEGP